MSAQQLTGTVLHICKMSTWSSYCNSSLSSCSFFFPLWSTAVYFPFSLFIWLLMNAPWLFLVRIQPAAARKWVKQNSWYLFFRCYIQNKWTAWANFASYPAAVYLLLFFFLLSYSWLLFELYGFQSELDAKVAASALENNNLTNWRIVKHHPTHLHSLLVREDEWIGCNESTMPVFSLYRSWSQLSLNLLVWNLDCTVYPLRSDIFSNVYYMIMQTASRLSHGRYNIFPLSSEPNTLFVLSV